MQAQARDHLPELTGLLTVISLALVFGAVLGYIPESILPRVDALVTAIPHVNAGIAALAIVTILVGVGAIQRGDVQRHKMAMLASTALFALFLILYLYRVSLEGPAAFGGPGWIERFVYLPLLAIHILLAIVCIPFVYYALLLAGTHSVRELPDTPHPRVGQIAATLWVISFFLGIVVYALLHLLY